MEFIHVVGDYMDISRQCMDFESEYIYIHIYMEFIHSAGEYLYI